MTLLPRSVAQTAGNTDPVDGAARHGLVDVPLYDNAMRLELYMGKTLLTMSQKQRLEDVE